METTEILETIIIAFAGIILLICLGLLGYMVSLWIRFIKRRREVFAQAGFRRYMPLAFLLFLSCLLVVVFIQNTLVLFEHL